MARLVSYKSRSEDRYSTFGGEVSYNSSENLTECNRIRLLPKKKSKLKKTHDKNKLSKIPETMPTISSSIEMHRNNITQSRAINGSSDGITRARRRPLNRSHRTQSRLNRNGSSRNCNWRCNQSCLNWMGCCCWWKWCCRRKCCSRICCGCIDYDDSENDDDDIDAKFEQYKNEMRLSELKNQHNATGTGMGTSTGNDNDDDAQETCFQSCSYRIEASTTFNDHKNPITSDGNAINDNSNGKTSKTTTKLFRNIWSWNDSLRSNSDKFLETLEYDMDNEHSLKRANNKHKRTDASARTKGYIPDLHVYICSERFQLLFVHCKTCSLACPTHNFTFFPLFLDIFQSSCFDLYR